MFSEMTNEMKARMAFLEKIDKKDRADGTGRLKRLRQIPPETGKFLALLAAGCPDGMFVEIGTSAGYSALWISLAMKARNSTLRTFELLPEKVDLARETFRIAGVTDYVELIEGDFLEKSKEMQNVSFCFLDCEKHLYEKCFSVVSERLVTGGLLVADNAINHYESLKPMIDRAESDERFDCLTVPIGKGEFICRRK